MVCAKETQESKDKRNAESSEAPDAKRLKSQSAANELFGDDNLGEIS